MTRYLLAAVLLLGAAWPTETGTSFVAFGYHDVVDDPADLSYDAILTRELAGQFDWLRAQGYRVVSLDDVLAAHRGERPLPARAVLLVFDDGYRSTYTRVFPLLQAFGYPAVFAVVGSWLDVDPGSLVEYAGQRVPRERFVMWEELAEMQRSGLAEIASHTYGLHGSVVANSEGGEIPAAVARRYSGRFDRSLAHPRAEPAPPVSRRPDLPLVIAAPYTRYAEIGARLVEAAMEYGFDPVTGRYETDAEYSSRVRADLARNSALIEARLGVRPRAIVWPFGRYNALAVEAARAEGMPVDFNLEAGRADAREIGRIGRFYPTRNPDVRTLADTLNERVHPPRVRGFCASLDDVYAPTDEERERKLGALIERAAALAPATIVLRVAASSPSAARGSVYFPNEHLPVRADVFSRAAWALRGKAGAEIFAWLPPELAGGDPRTALETYEALGKSVPFDGLDLGPRFLASALAPGAPIPVRSWNPDTARRRRAAQDGARLSESARRDLAAIESVSRYVPALRVLDVVPLDAIRPPGKVALDAVEHLAVRWDGDPRVALRKLAGQGWLATDVRERLVYLSSRSEPEVWRAVQGAGLSNGLYCPDRLPDDAATLTALRPFLSAASYPFPRR